MKDGSRVLARGTEPPMTRQCPHCSALIRFVTAGEGDLSSSLKDLRVGKHHLLIKIFLNFNLDSPSAPLIMPNPKLTLSHLCSCSLI